MPLKGTRVYGDQSEGLVVAMGPLEVVEQAPREIAAQWNTVLYSFLAGENVLAIIFDSQSIMDVAGTISSIIECGSVFQLHRVL